MMIFRSVKNYYITKTLYNVEILQHCDLAIDFMNYYERSFYKF